MNPFQSSGIFMGAFFLEFLTVRYDAVGYASVENEKMSLVSSTRERILFYFEPADSWIMATRMSQQRWQMMNIWVLSS